MATTSTAPVISEDAGALDGTAVRRRNGRNRSASPRNRVPRSGRRGRKPASERSEAVTPVRYFLTKEGQNGIPMLDREFSGENEVLIEALKQNRIFVVVTEWQATVETSSGVPVIGKIPVNQK